MGHSDSSEWTFLQVPADYLPKFRLIYIDTLPTHPSQNLLTIQGLQNAAFWPPERRPSLRTLREWSRLRKIPVVKIGKFCLYNAEEVRAHLQSAFTVKPR